MHITLKKSSELFYGAEQYLLNRCDHNNNEGYRCIL